MWEPFDFWSPYLIWPGNPPRGGWDKSKMLKTIQSRGPTLDTNNGECSTLWKSLIATLPAACIQCRSSILKILQNFWFNGLGKIEIFLWTNIFWVTFKQFTLPFNPEFEGEDPPQLSRKNRNISIAKLWPTASSVMLKGSKNWATKTRFRTFHKGYPQKVFKRPEIDFYCSFKYNFSQICQTVFYNCACNTIFCPR